MPLTLAESLVRRFGAQPLGGIRLQSDERRDGVQVFSPDGCADIGYPHFTLRWEPDAALKELEVGLSTAILYAFDPYPKLAN